MAAADIAAWFSTVVAAWRPADTAAIIEDGLAPPGLRTTALGSEANMDYWTGVLEAIERGSQACVAAAESVRL